MFDFWCILKNIWKNCKYEIYSFLLLHFFLDFTWPNEKKTLINTLQINGLEVIKTKTIFDDYILSVTVKNKDKKINKKILQNNFNIQSINRNLEKSKKKISLFFKKFKIKSNYLTQK